VDFNVINGKRKVKAICWAEKKWGGGRKSRTRAGVWLARSWSEMFSQCCALLYPAEILFLKSCCSSDRSGSAEHCTNRTNAMPVQTSGAGIDESNTSVVIRFASYSHNIKYYKKDYI